MIVFDTNAILRYILQDNEEMADLVEKQMQKTECFVPTEVVAEIVYVLSRVYKIPHNEISEAINDVLSMECILTADYDAITKGLEVYAQTNFDFVDCLMIGYQHKGYTVFTFDKALKKYLQKSTGE